MNERNDMGKFKDAIGMAEREVAKGDLKDAEVRALLAIAGRLDRLCEILPARR